MYVHYGYAINNNWEVDVRYDEYNRLTNSVAGERKFETLTLGAQYFFNKKSRLIVNYEQRDAGAPNNAGADNLLSNSIDDRLSLQILTIF
jgi:predicted porin